MTNYRTRRSFTLLEVLLALVIIIMIVSTVYSFYHYSARLVLAGRAKLQRSRVARIILRKISDELTATTPAGGDFFPVLEGESDKLTFVTTVVPSKAVFFPQKESDSARIVEHDLRKVEYSLAKDDKDSAKILGLRRDELRSMLTPMVEKKSSAELTPEELEKAREDQQKFKINFDMGGSEFFSNQPVVEQKLISRGIKYLRFDYYDGKNWWPVWKSGNSRALPRAVRVTIGFKAVPEDQLQDELLLPPEERHLRDDQFALLVPLILSDEIHSKAGASHVQ